MALRYPTLSCNNSLPSTSLGTALLSVSFNHDFDRFACGTSQGFRIYNCDPFIEILRREFGNGGVRIVEMVVGWHNLAFVGGEENAEYPPNEVMIWDEYETRCIDKICFRSKVVAVKLRLNQMVVVLENEIYVFNSPFYRLKLLQQIKTLPNPKGLCAVSKQQGSCVLACPGLVAGQVRVDHFLLNKTQFISAHDSNIACICLSDHGGLLATASEKGTLVRIFDSWNGACLQEVRRGADKAEIYSIALSGDSKLLAVSSNKATVHVFGVQGKDLSTVNSSAKKQVARSLVKRVKGVLPKYFSSEWSFAQFHLEEKTRCVVGFERQNTIVIVGMDGRFYRCEFDPVHGGKMVLKDDSTFL